MPQLPHAGRGGRGTRAGDRWGGYAVHLRGAGTPAAARRRKHAGICDETFSARGDSAGELSRNSTSRGPTAGAGCFAALREQRGTRSWKAWRAIGASKHFQERSVEPQIPRLPPGGQKEGGNFHKKS